MKDIAPSGEILSALGSVPLTDVDAHPVMKLNRALAAGVSVFRVLSSPSPFPDTAPRLLRDIL